MQLEGVDAMISFDTMLMGLCNVHALMQCSVVDALFVYTIAIVASKQFCDFSSMSFFSI